MYLSFEICRDSFSQLRNIAPSSEDGKKAGERVSGLRYLLALARLLKEKKQDQIDLSPSQSENRKLFTQYVGDVVRFDSDGCYTNNFIDEVKSTKGFGVSSNFLTTTLKKDGPYPGRPSPLIVREAEKLSLLNGWEGNLANYGYWPDYRNHLAIWLCRFADFQNSKDIVSEIKNYILTTYGDEVLTVLVDDSHLNKILHNVTLSNAPPDFTALISDLNTESLSKESNNSLSGGAENKIFYGAPGTGKSYKIFTEICGDTEEYKFVTVFHPDTQYNDFVGSLKPMTVMINKIPSVTYAFRPGPFTNALVKAKLYPSEHIFLVIEEINRAPAAAVFGELFQLLDRNKTGESTYGINASDPDLLEHINERLREAEVPEITELKIPANLSLLATMNSSDQAVMPLDTAFKRRWSFEYLEIDFAKNGVAKTEFELNTGKDTYIVSWPQLAEIINIALTEIGVAEDRLIGPFFLSARELGTSVEAKKSLRSKLFVYLWDDVLRHLGHERLFDPELKTFGKLSRAFSDGKCIFNSKLCLAIESIGLKVEMAEN